MLVKVVVAAVPYVIGVLVLGITTGDWELARLTLGYGALLGGLAGSIVLSIHFAENA